MRPGTFEEALRRFNATQPFRPFTVELVNGVRLISRHPEAIILEGHLRTCVPEGIKGDREDAVIQELIQLYTIAGNQ